MYPLRAWILGLVMLTGAACTPREQPEPAGGGPLLLSVQAAPSADRVRFTLQVTNTAEAPVRLSFASGQSFDFIVSRGGVEVWRWSSENMFTQALRSETLGPGETVTHDAVWIPGSRLPGEYSVVGVLTSSDHPARQEARFRIE